LLDLRKVSSDKSWERVKKAYDKGYRIESATVDDWAESDWDFFNNRDKTPIHFIGVWDTVGALGVPDDMELFNFLDDKDNWQFHNTALGNNVKHARHAMAMDEIRSSFSITRWSNAKQHDDAVELWFPGVHSDVGGGYANSDLSTGALLWMIKESETVGLSFRAGIHQLIKPNPLGVIHNSYKGAFAKLRSRPRNITAMIPENKNYFHKTAIERQRISPIEHPAYHPTQILDIGESVTVNIFADTRWNATQLYLPKGHCFTFSATGKWLDSKDSCDWKGTQNDELTAGDVVRTASSLWGKIENVFKKQTNNASTDFFWTKRVENMNWFTLIGAISNDAGADHAVGNDGSPLPHQYVELSAYESTALEITDPGYLYAFPNDVWSLYGNNHGSIQLTIKRTA